MSTGVITEHDMFEANFSDLMRIPDRPGPSMF